MEPLKLEVSHQEFDAVIFALMKRPYEDVAQLIAKLVAQVQSQRPPLNPTLPLAPENGQLAQE